MHRRTVLAALIATLVSPAAAADDEPKIVRDAKSYAEFVATALNSSGYRADYTLESLKEIDRFFDEQTLGGKAKPGGLLSEQFGARLFGLGGYVGEVIRRRCGGQWQGDDNDPDGEINIAVHLNSGATFWPMQRVVNRVQYGAEDGIWVYGASLATVSDGGP